MLLMDRSRLTSFQQAAPSARRAASTVLALLVIAGCNARPASDATSATQSATTSSSAAPRVRGACCPESDTALMALMQRYENTPERERPAELAIWPYRMTTGLAERERIVVRDSATWASLWPQLVGSHSPRPVLPAVHFADEMLIVVSMGTRSSGGYIVMIDSIRVTSDTLRVFVREQSPGPRCGTTAALTAPAALARLERSELPVTFATRETVRDCD